MNMMAGPFYKQTEIPAVFTADFPLARPLT